MREVRLLTSLAEVAIIAGVGLLWHHIGYKNGYNKAVESIISQSDTIYRQDTIRLVEPLYLTEWKVRTEYVPITDTMRIHDTTYVALDRTVKSYADSSFYAEVSGINPSLDHIEVYQQTRNVYYTITQRLYPKKDYFSLRVDGLYNKTFMMPITLNVGYRLKGFEMSAGAGYDPIQKSPVFRAGAELKIGFGEAK